MSAETALSNSDIADTHSHTYSLGYLLRIDCMIWVTQGLSEAQGQKIDVNSQWTTKSMEHLLKTSKN